MACLSLARRVIADTVKRLSAIRGRDKENNVVLRPTVFGPGDPGYAGLSLHRRNFALASVVSLIAERGMTLPPVAVDQARLSQILSSAKTEEVDLSVEKDKQGNQMLEIRHGRSLFKIQAIPADEAPDYRPIDDANVASYVVDAKLFLNVIKRAQRFTDPSNSRYAMGGIYFEANDHTLTVIATDGRCMYVETLPCVVSDPAKQPLGQTAGYQPILPEIACAALVGLAHDTGELTMRFAGGLFEFASVDGLTRFSARSVEGKFPDWRDVAATAEKGHPARIRFQSAVSLIEAIRLCAIFTTPESIGISLDWDRDLRLSSDTTETGAALTSVPLTEIDGPIAVGHLAKISSTYAVEIASLLDPVLPCSIEIRGPKQAIVVRQDAMTVYLMTLTNK